MSDRKLAKLILKYLPWWDLPHLDEKENYKMILDDLKTRETTRNIYDYLYNEDETNELYIEIMQELDNRLLCGGIK